MIVYVEDIPLEYRVFAPDGQMAWMPDLSAIAGHTGSFVTEYSYTYPDEPGQVYILAQVVIDG